MTPRDNSPQEWRSVVEAVLAYRPEAREFYQHESTSHGAITRLFHGLEGNTELERALSRAVFELLDETLPTKHNIGRLFHLIRMVGAIKPDGGLRLLGKMLRDNVFWYLEHDGLNLHTLLLSMCGSYLIPLSFAEWIRADCIEKASFKQTLTGFCVLAAQEITPAALFLLESAIDQATSEAEASLLASEIKGLSHPYADLHAWIRGIRANKPALFDKGGQILGKYLLKWDQPLLQIQDPYRIMFKAEIFAGRKSFPMKDIRSIATTIVEYGIDSAIPTLKLLHEVQKWKTYYDKLSFATYLHISGGPNDVVILDRSSEPKLVKLLAEVGQIAIDGDPHESETDFPETAPQAGLFWHGGSGLVI